MGHSEDQETRVEQIALEAQTSATEDMEARAGPLLDGDLDNQYTRGTQSDDLLGLL